MESQSKLHGSKPPTSTGLPVLDFLDEFLQTGYGTFPNLPSGDIKCDSWVPVAGELRETGGTQIPGHELGERHIPHP